MSLSRIGAIAMKGRARFAGEPTSAEVIRRGRDWYLSVTFDVEDEQLARPCAKQGPFAFDAGITDLLTTLKYHDGQVVYDTQCRTHAGSSAGSTTSSRCSEK